MVVTKRNLSYILLSFVLLFSCSKNTNSEKPVIDADKVLKSTMTFLVYRQKYLRLSEDFTALNMSSKVISKKLFLELLSSGDYLPLRLISKDSTGLYKLYKLSDTTNEDIRETIKNWGEHLYTLYNLEGTKLPEFNFVDIDGRIYNKETTNGKFVILKCWFIGCGPCVAEMPALNELEKKYENRKDILFLSLAFDSKEKLKEFLKKHSFNYSAVPAQKKYIVEELKITSFPTHLIINKQGLIAKVVNDNKELEHALQKELLK